MITEVFDLNIPSQKQAFEQWESENHISEPDDSIDDVYNSSKRLSFGERYGELNCVLENDEFEVYGFCAGEWGGGLFFVDKKHREKIRYLSATCPVMVDFYEGKYRVTATLAHRSGFGSVFVVWNPHALPLVSLEELSEKKLPSAGKPDEVLLNTAGLTINLFYPYQGRNFLVYTTNDSTWLGEIWDGRLIQREMLLPHPAWNDSPAMNRKQNGIYISEIWHRSSFRDQAANREINETLNGTIYVKQDTLVLGYQHRLSR